MDQNALGPHGEREKDWNGDDEAAQLLTMRSDFQYEYKKVLMHVKSLVWSPGDGDRSLAIINKL